MSTRNIVLTVDDEVAVLRSLTSALAQYGLNALVAESGPEGIDIFEKNRDDIALVIADVVMPGMSGTVMAKRIREIDPEARIILMSGYPEQEAEAVAKNEFPFMEKPIRAGDLLLKIEALIGPVMHVTERTAEVGGASGAD